MAANVRSIGLRTTTTQIGDLQPKSLTRFEQMEKNAIDTAVNQFMAKVDGHDRPFRYLVDFLSVLSGQGWCSHDITTLRNAILAAMAISRMKDW